MRLIAATVGQTRPAQVEPALSFNSSISSQPADLEAPTVALSGALAPSGPSAEPVLNHGTALDGQTGIDSALDITIVPDTSSTVQRVIWYVDDGSGFRLFRDDDSDSPYELQYNGSLLQLDTSITAPSGLVFEISTDGGTYGVRPEVEYSGETVVSEATFTTAVSEEPPPPSGGVGNYEQVPFTVSLTTGGTISFDPADYATADLIFPRDWQHVGLAAQGVDRSTLATVGSGKVTVSLNSQPGSPSGSGTENDPFVYTLNHFESLIEVDGNPGEIWVEFDRCWGEGNSLWGIKKVGGGSAVHVNIYDSDIQDSGGGIMGEAAIAGVSDLTVRRCFLTDGVDGIKFSNGTSLVEDCYIVCQTDDPSSHVDVFQVNPDGTEGTHVIRRSWLQAQCTVDGSIKYGNGGLHCKPDNDGPIQVTFEDCLIQGRNWGIHRNGNSDPNSFFVSRRNIFAPTLDGSNDLWNHRHDGDTGGTLDPFKDQQSPKSTVDGTPDRTTRSSTDDYHVNGFLLDKSTAS